MELVPLDLEDANGFVRLHHRHHQPVVGHKFSIGASLTGELIAIAIIGRPVARALDDGFTLEVTRLATDGRQRPLLRVNRRGGPCFHNPASFLLGAARRAAFGLGYRRLGTYILDTETGLSLVAAGWKLVGEVTGRSWDTPSRPRTDKHPTQGKFRFEVVA